jgi:hypothetical protein
MSWLFICCCKPFLRGHGDDRTEYYRLLGVDEVGVKLLQRPGSPDGSKDSSCDMRSLTFLWLQGATTDDIKRAYKKKSLLMHPDKLAQRGQTLTAEDQANVSLDAPVSKADPLMLG